MKNEKEKLSAVLQTIFEPALVEEMVQFPLIQIPANLLVGKEDQKLDYFSIILQGSVRAIKFDEKGKEILIYNIEPLQTCILTFTAVVRDHNSVISAITNSEVTALGFPKIKASEWMKKYESWRKFTLELYEWRLNELLANHQILRKQKDSILESIHYAKRIQNAVLPPEKYIKNLLPEHFILYKPRDIVSGDYYWMTKIQDKIIFVAADCTGHGVPGAFMSMLGITLLNQYVNNHELLPANEIMELLRSNVKECLRQSDYESDTRDGMDMALLIFDNTTHELEFSGANNPLYIISEHDMIKLEADKMPVGVYIDESRKFTRQTYKFKKGDIFYTFSDGYIDQTGGDKNRKYMRKNFVDLLTKIHQKPLKEQKDILESNLDEWKGTNEQIDDILVVGIKV